MKDQTRELTLTSNPIDATYSRFKDPNPSVVLLTKDAGRKDWIITINDEKEMQKVLALKVGEHVSVSGVFEELDVITNNGRSVRRTVKANSAKRIAKLSAPSHRASFSKHFNKGNNNSHRNSAYKGKHGAKAYQSKNNKAVVA